MVKIIPGIIISAFLIQFVFPFSAAAQDTQKPIQVAISTIKTELKQKALNVGISYVKSLDSLWERQDYLLSGDRSLFLITPEINIESGSEDAFSSVSLKIKGLAMVFKTIEIGGILTPNTSRTFQTFPIAIGIESNNRFNIVNGIAEIGWVPWYQSASRKTPALIKQTKFGIFFQGGYKFAFGKADVTPIGGEIDQSQEKVDNAICRLKGSFAINTRSLFQLSGVGIGLVGRTDGWYDLLNKQVYYTYQAKLRMYLTKNQDKFFDFAYQKGSGAPNFNKGEQFGMGLTITF